MHQFAHGYLSRRGFLATGVASVGGLLVAVSFAGSSQAQTGTPPTQAVDTDAFKPSAYIEVTTEGAVDIFVGKSEMGQGIHTGIAQLIGDELGCAWESIRVVQAPASPAFGFPGSGFMVTGGSTSIRTEWQRMRMMGAAARMMLEEAAARRWAVNAGDLSTADGVISGPGGQTAGFAELVMDASRLEVPANPQLKPKSARSLIGTSVKRLDTMQKITGRAGFGIDVEIPGLLTAIVVSPPQLMAPVRSFDATQALARPGVRKVIAISTGIAIIGDHYWAVHSARDEVTVEWGDSPFAGLNMESLRAGYRDALDKDGIIAETKGDVSPVSGAKSVNLEIEQPFLAHACMEPMNLTVAINNKGAEVWGPVQAQSWVQQTVGKVAGLDPENVAVHTTFLGGGFGRRSAKDFVKAAAEIAMSAGKPVKLVYSREDDMRAAYYRPFNLTRARGTLDSEGNMLALDVKVATPSVASWAGARFMIRKDGIDEQAVEGLVDLPYNIPNIRISWVEHDTKIPVHFWRAVGSSHNPFVLESLIDDLAVEAGMEPIAFRRRLLQGQPRYLAVLDRLVSDAGWKQPAPRGVGRGMAIVRSFGSIVAQAVEISQDNGELHVAKVFCVVDCGIAINPGQIEAQMHSSIIYGLGALLRGQITIDDGAIEQSNFHDFEPLRHAEMPQISVSIIEGDDKPGGVGEPGLPPILPAVANAVRALTGKRTVRLPLAG